MKRSILLILGIIALVLPMTAQVLQPVKWKITTEKVTADTYNVICKATIEDSWHLYDSELPEGGALPTTFNLDEDESSGIELIGTFKANEKAISEYSEAFKMELKYFTKTVTFIQKVKLTQPKARLIGYVEFMACRGGQCIPPAEADFDFELKK